MNTLKEINVTVKIWPHSYFCGIPNEWIGCDYFEGENGLYCNLFQRELDMDEKGNVKKCEQCLKAIKGK